jgi:alanyl-tRNA synthetase
LRDYQKKTEELRDVCQTLTAGEEDAATMVRRWKAERKDSAKKIRSLLNEKLEAEASALWNNAERIGSYRIVSMVFDDRDPEEVQHLVNTLARKDDVVTLMGVKQERGYVFIGRSKNIEIDVRPWLEQACRIIDGRGGGSPSMARGSGEKVVEVDKAIEKARTLCFKEMS